MMKKNNSLNALILKIMLFFIGSLLLILVLFQFILLKPMYEGYRLNLLANQSKMVANAYLSGNLEKTIQDLGKQGGTCIRVVSATSDQMYGSKACLLSDLSNSETMALQKNALLNHGHYAYHHLFQISGSSQTFQGVIDVRVLVDGKDVVMAMVYDVITPISATRQTLITQIWIIGFFLFLMILAITILIRQRVAKPLIEMNQAAKELGKGVYPSEKVKPNYREVQELNQTLSQAALDIQKADRAKRDLLANVSHDLKTPLTMISGYGELMQDIPTEKTAENLQIIIDEANHLNLFVNDLLDLSRLNDQQVLVQAEKRDLIQELKPLVHQYEVYAKKENRRFETSLLEHYEYETDYKLLIQVIQNFLSNAFHYTESGDAIYLELIEKDRGYRLQVRDSGIGIEEKDLKNIFDRYYKIKQEHRRSAYGSGIGLSIAKQNLDLLKLRYGVISKIGEGSTFWIDL
ncbi:MULTISPECIES: cell wall metabolism sensor histidine kinase WalK [Terrabacteria group]|uniref:sensor histidine kinase n=1 Tax=Bacillati TaxID=1783272 RepID=UPI00193AC9D1|nr:MULTISPECIES: HAMP domain-containing sensor histidine kinase [Terrabacteria group]MBW9213049.1 HAMP domain-containing histidine kinase [Trueperella sp. zg.1013]QRG87424.1 HAMP domain-containing histidine kinase [Bulleidia sp. zg-1006]